MPKKTQIPKGVDPMVAATLTGIIYQAKLFNRQAKVNVPEEEVIVEVISLWRIVTDALNSETLPGIGTAGPPRRWSDMGKFERGASVCGGALSISCPKRIAQNDEKSKTA